MGLDISPRAEAAAIGRASDDSTGGSRTWIGLGFDDQLRHYAPIQLANRDALVLLRPWIRRGPRAAADEDSVGSWREPTQTSLAHTKPNPQAGSGGQARAERSSLRELIPSFG